MPYAGSEWAAEQFEQTLSPLGISVADLLGDVFEGIYHLNAKALRRAEWTNAIHIEIEMHGELATWDADNLTALVILCHDRCLRLAIRGGEKRGSIRLCFSPRTRDGNTYQRMPVLTDHVTIIRSRYPRRGDQHL